MKLGKTQYNPAISGWTYEEIEKVFGPKAKEVAKLFGVKKQIVKKVKKKSEEGEG